MLRPRTQLALLPAAEITADAGVRSAGSRLLDPGAAAAPTLHRQTQRIEKEIQRASQAHATARRQDCSERRRDRSRRAGVLRRRKLARALLCGRYRRLAFGPKSP